MAWIYRIVRLKSGQCYIGHTSRKDANDRWTQHFIQLTAGKHHSRYLQNSWKKHGADAFKFEVIEQCDEADKLKREQHWIDGLNSCYNHAKVAGSRKGVKFTRIQRELLSKLRMGHVTSDETRKKISAAHLGKKQEPHTDKSKRKIGQSSRKWWKNNDQTPAQRAAMIESLKLARLQSKANKPGWIPKHRIGVKDSAATIEKRRQSRLKTEATRAPRCWITDGIVEQQVETSAAIPEGWRRGRQPKIGEVGRSRVGEKRSDEARANMSRAHLKRNSEQCESPL